MSRCWSNGTGPRSSVNSIQVDLLKFLPYFSTESCRGHSGSAPSRAVYFCTAFIWAKERHCSFRFALKEEIDPPRSSLRTNLAPFLVHCTHAGAAREQLIVWCAGDVLIGPRVTVRFYSAVYQGSFGVHPRALVLAGNHPSTAFVPLPAARGTLLILLTVTQRTEAPAGCRCKIVDALKLN